MPFPMLFTRARSGARKSESAAAVVESARGLAQSKTLARGPGAGGKAPENAVAGTA